MSDHLCALLEKQGIWDAHENWETLLVDIEALQNEITRADNSVNVLALQRRLDMYRKHLVLPPHLRDILERAASTDRLGLICYMFCFCAAIRQYLE